MTSNQSRVSDDAVEQLIGRLLQIGVLIAAAITLVGGTLLLIQHGRSPVDYSTFRGEPSYLRSLSGIVAAAFQRDTRAIVQLGLAFLIATPIARVAFTLVAFALQRDRVYVGVTLLVLALLLFGLLFGIA
ncbi:MAG TPA: DUF1634 domain-containing protein [Gemmatimonadaceae bacterium]|nr:DUF1634 domain-containing protein [Gemmatimonadaceae bacterium]